MTRPAALLALVLPGLALAQTGAMITLTVGGSDQAAASAGDCNKLFQVAWTATAVGVTPTSELSFWATTGNCDDKPAAGDKTYSSVPLATWTQQRSDSFNIVVKDLPMFGQADGGAACGSTGIEKTVKLCAAFSYLLYTTTTWVRVSSPPTITYDTVPPSPPAIDELSPQDQALIARFTASSDSTFVHFELRAQGDVDFQPSVDAPGTSTSARIAGLANGTTYDVRATAEDAAGNFSEPSEIASGTPIFTEGFWSIYRKEGGSGTGGCAAGGGAFGLAGAVFLARLVIRRRRP